MARNNVEAAWPFFDLEIKFINQALHTFMIACSLSSLFLKMLPKEAISSDFIPCRSLATCDRPLPSRETLAMEATPNSMPRIFTAADLGSCTVS